MLLSFFFNSAFLDYLKFLFPLKFFLPKCYSFIQRNFHFSHNSFPTSAFSVLASLSSTFWCLELPPYLLSNQSFRPSYLRPAYLSSSYVRPIYLRHYLRHSYLGPIYLRHSYLGPAYLCPTYLWHSYLRPTCLCHLSPAFFPPSYLSPVFFPPSYLPPSYLSPAFLPPSYTYLHWHYVSIFFINPTNILIGIFLSKFKPLFSHPHILAELS